MSHTWKDRIRALIEGAAERCSRDRGGDRRAQGEHRWELAVRRERPLAEVEPEITEPEALGIPGTNGSAGLPTASWRCCWESPNLTGSTATAPVQLAEGDWA